MNETTQKTAEPEYRLGAPDIECRYPVLVGEQILGRVFRWHGVWYAVPAGTTEEVRVADGGARRGGGSEGASHWLFEQYKAGLLTPRTMDYAAVAPSADGPVPLLHPRMASTPRNLEAARVALAGLAEHRWTPLSGYPGSDNPWHLQCQLCGWKGPRYWSHLRGRNGNPPSITRHDDGCVGAEAVREAIAAYQQ
ncbi:hypothetical protein ACF07Y_46480 [Streptomyces sp. NPDC016566]|uniref:hypothetical protein n=1 Tax=Streptomyces sp. NPDC016566 TaxID=3364967 RepID=UPI0036F72CB8